MYKVLSTKMSTSDEDSNQILKHQTTKSRESPTWWDVFPQIISACVAHTLVIHVGIHMIYSTVQIPHLNLSTEQSSWLVGLVTITNPIGALCIGPVMDRIGRKASLLLVYVPFILSSALSLLSSSKDIELLYLSKIFAGVGSGMSTVAMVYVSEICHGVYRPALLCLNSVFISFGILLTSLLNLYLDWKALSICFLCLILLSGTLLTCLAPESPHWLINFDRSFGDYARIAKAERSLKYLNPNKELYKQEWQLLSQVRIKHDQTSNQRSLIRKIITSKQCYKPIMLLLILFSLQQFTGVYPVIFYAMQLFKQVGTDFGAGIDESSALVLLAVIRFVMSVATTVLARRFGRKPLLIVSAAGLCLFSLLLSTNIMIKYNHKNCVNSDLMNFNASKHHGKVLNHKRSSEIAGSLDFDEIDNLNVGYNKSNHHNISSHDHTHSLHLNETESPNNMKSCTSLHPNLSSDRLSLFFILLYVCFSAVGVIVIPWTMIGELLPSYARGTCSGFLISYGYVWMFFMVKMFPAAMDYSVVGTFNMFAVVSFLLAAFVLFYVPETKGKSFVEIERFFL